MNDFQHESTAGSTTEALAQAREEIARCVIGHDREIERLLCAILAGRHVLVEGVPGLGKTLLVRTIAGVLGCTFKRIQFTPDLLPADILGGSVYNPRDGSFSLRKGPIFAQVILGDEINRAPAKTQSAMLEVMQERQVTLEGETILLERPFFVFATQNPIDHEGVFPLPQAQLDRFAMRLLVEYQSAEEEQRILAAHRSPLPQPRAVLDAERIRAFQDQIEAVTVSDQIMTLIVRLGAATRSNPAVELGASPRVAIDLMHLARARALLEKRSHVIPDDVKSLFFDVVNHRLVLSPQAEMSGLSAREVANEALKSLRLV